MKNPIDLNTLQKNLISYLNFYVECFYGHEEGDISIRVFNVPEQDAITIAHQIYDFEDKFLPNCGYILMPLIKTETETRENYPEILPKIDEYNNQRSIQTDWSNKIEISLEKINKKQSAYSPKNDIAPAKNTAFEPMALAA